MRSRIANRPRDRQIECNVFKQKKKSDGHEARNKAHPLSKTCGFQSVGEQVVSTCQTNKKEKKALIPPIIPSFGG